MLKDFASLEGLETLFNLNVATAENIGVLFKAYRSYFYNNCYESGPTTIEDFVLSEDLNKHQLIYLILTDFYCNTVKKEDYC